MATIYGSAECRQTLDSVWACATEKEHIIHWYSGQDDWECTAVDQDLRVRGAFKYTLITKDKTFSRVQEGNFLRVEAPHILEYLTKDGRKVTVSFAQSGNTVMIEQIAETERNAPFEFQRRWQQKLLNNLATYAEEIGGV